MIKQHQLKSWATCIVVAMAAIPTSAVSASSVYYNTSQAYSVNIGTDNNVGQDGITMDPNTKVVNTTFAGWNSSTSLLPFGFNNERLNWAAEITASGDALTVSSQDAHDRYGIWADIDTAQGAWFDGSSSGWEHQTDVGVIKSDVDAIVSINIAGRENPNADPNNGLWTNFGVSVYSGMPEGVWKFHAAWNCPSCTVNLPSGKYRYFADFQDDTPLSDSGMTYITHNATVDSVNSISFNASAGTVYTILLGGNSGGSVYDPKEGYAVSITTASPVPVPSALWLFGGALVSLTGAIGKNRSKA